VNKIEVSEYLGVSKRQVEKLVASGKLSVVYEMIDNRRTAVFNRAEVEAHKEQRETPVHRSALSPPSSGEFGDSSLVRTGEFEGEILLSVVDKVIDYVESVSQSVPFSQKLLLTPSEAAAYSGLTQLQIKQAMGDGRLASVKVGKGRKVRRVDVEVLVNSFFS
jgi:excisionase family DNA binding protein